MSLEYMLKKRETLLAELRSDEHYELTPTVAYGNHDPFNVPEVVCEACGGAACDAKVSWCKYTLGYGLRVRT